MTTQQDAPGRAPALPLEDRREMILDAVVPLLVAHGSDVTSKQIAEAAGIAEGTVFRAFGDKESLIRAAAEKFFDPETVRNGLRAIDPDDPLDAKVAQIIAVLRTRFTGALRVMAAVGREPQMQPVRRPHLENSDIIERIFAPDAARLAWPAERITHLLRLLSFASSIPPVSEAATPFTNDELAQLVVHGITGTNGVPA
ncbi:TetR/AcrR family transcriptional regulator [Herbiconiux sp. 11R-BC]|uniref:TetR/AcrR family transcriptional regulator n=1 Tax=Herbiconiux sp. 11R-BC TaxID=3111637 RepID=UPI003C0C37D6